MGAERVAMIVESMAPRKTPTYMLERVRMRRLVLGVEAMTVSSVGFEEEDVEEEEGRGKGWGFERESARRGLLSSGSLWKFGGSLGCVAVAGIVRKYL